jgi:hypothetical protein
MYDSVATTPKTVIESCWFLIRTIADAWANKAPKVNNGDDSDDENDAAAAADEAAEAAEEAAKPKAKKAGKSKGGKKGSKGKGSKGRTADEDDEEEEEPKKASSGKLELGEAKDDTKNAFNVYYAPVMGAIMTALSSNAPEDLKQRAAATACLAGVASCVGAERFKLALPRVLEAIFLGMELDNNAIRNASYSFMYQ